jgi:adenylosuccinate lyase
MIKLFSPRRRAIEWRRLWLWLAQAEKGLGINKITDAALTNIAANLFVSDEAFQFIAEQERITRHEVMAHIMALERDAPAARGQVHIGVTSCFVCNKEPPSL